MTSLALPVEIIFLIMREYDMGFSTLANLRLTNKLFDHEARSILYRVLNSSPSLNIAAPVGPLLAYPTRAIHIQRLVLTPPTLDVYTRILRPGPALSSMLNLKELDIHIDSPPPDDFLHGAPFQLRVFRFEHSAPIPKIAEFLVTQHHLQRLVVRGVEQLRGRIPTYSCPDLVHLECDREVLESYLPGRRVSTLLWRISSSDGLEPLDHLSRELGALNLFSFVDDKWRWNLNTDPPLSFLALVPHLKELRYLEVQAHTGEVQKAICQLSKLEGIVIEQLRDAGSKRFRESSPLGDALRRQACASFFRHCPLLRFVDIRIGVGGGRLLQRWIPGADREPELLQGTLIFYKTIFDSINHSMDPGPALTW